MPTRRLNEPFKRRSTARRQNHRAANIGGRLCKFRWHATAAQLAAFLATVENHCEAGDLAAAAALTGDRLDQLCQETLAAFNAAAD